MADKDSKPTKKPAVDAGRTVIKPASKAPGKQAKDVGAAAGSEAAKATLSQKDVVDRAKTVVKAASLKKKPLRPQSQARAGAQSADKPVGGSDQSLSADGVKSNAGGEEQQYDAALTRIQRSLKKSDNSTGFIKAKRAADRALADNKIILNKRFVLERTLGTGGMGTVYRARDLRKVEANDLKPHVAVKVLSEEFRDHPDAFVSLQREASRSHVLSHPKIVTVHDFDRDGDVIYMTMELLEGESLDAFLRSQAGVGVNKAQAFGLIADYCSALSYAHKKDIVHSDLKPGNIFVTPDGAKVLDFGIARVVNESAVDDFDAGSLGALTPAYASLEMIEFLDPAPSDDVYAAAIIAYELLAGRHPYDREAADKALANKRQPERIASLTNQEWKALDQALKLRRGERTSNIDEFVTGLTRKRKFPLFKVASALLLLVAAAFAYVIFFGANDVSRIANNAYQKAQACFDGGQYSCAIERSKAVLELQPKDARAKTLLDKALAAKERDDLQKIQDKSSACFGDANIVCMQGLLNDLDSMDVDNTLRLAIQGQIDELNLQQEIKQLIKQSQRCIVVQDYHCALEAAQKAVTLDADNTAAQQLEVEVMQRREQQQNQEVEYNQYLRKAKSCLAGADYDCAIGYADQALALKSGDSDAQAVKQSAQFSKREMGKNMNKAEKLVAKARACYKAKNYTCAISNSESALEFVEHYAPAVSLRKMAKEELTTLKNSINIQ